MADFKTNIVRILVASDVAARGLDLRDITYVQGSNLATILWPLATSFFENPKKKFLWPLWPEFFMFFFENIVAKKK